MPHPTSRIAACCSYLERTSLRVNRWVETALFGIGLSMALIVAVQVFCRYVLNQSLFWSEELARYLLVWLSFLGASVAYRRRVHPGVDLITDRLTPSLRKSAAVGVHLASLFFFSVMIVFGSQFAHFVRHQISPALVLPKWIVLAVIPVSGAILFLHGLCFLAGEVTGRSHDR